MMKILITGDSFAADWTIAKNLVGWPNLLANDFDVVNIAQAGCSEYKIHRQLSSVDLSQFDSIIVAHTSPNRLYVKNHPVHFSSALHKNSDLIYADIKEHASTDKNLDSIVDYFEKYFDIEYAEFVHTLICKEIDLMLSNFAGNVIHLTGFDWTNLYQFNELQVFSDLAIHDRGLANHFDTEGNEKVYQTVKKLILR
jgi:hypothetical protein